ncbi:squalene/phytoene synthase family protein [Streptomyces sp. ALB3]|uniref:squalene/phytoene synthase family protein n=1 Tax=Streptomyces sp. ALB3 TaxID=3374278 RepID=UPI0037AF52DD
MPALPGPFPGPETGAAAPPWTPTTAVTAGPCCPTAPHSEQSARGATPSGVRSAWFATEEGRRSEQRDGKLSARSCRLLAHGRRHTDLLAGLAEELRGGNLCLPAEDAQRHGVTRGDLEQGRDTPGVRALISATAGTAHGVHARRGRPRHRRSRGASSSVGALRIASAPPAAPGHHVAGVPVACPRLLVQERRSAGERA